MPKLLEGTWKSIIDSNPEVVVVVDREGKILYLNHGMPGTNKDEAVGQSQYNFIEPGHHDLVRKTIESVFETGVSQSYEIQGFGVDGKSAWYSTRVGPVVVDGETVAVSLFTSNVTQARAAEEKLKRTQEEMLSKQSRAILELSTPVIQIWDEIQTGSENNRSR